MKERPILMSGPMVRAILEGRKTQTRRIVKPRPHESTTAFRDIPDTDNWYGAISTKNDLGEAFYPNPAHGDFRWRCPYGKPGDRLWVREAWKVPATLNKLSGRDIANKSLAAAMFNDQSVSLIRIDRSEHVVATHSNTKFRQI